MRIEIKMQSEKYKMQNGNNHKATRNISDRLEDFAAEVIKRVYYINRTFAGRHVAGELIRASTSAGANYEEACGAESRQDFIHKLQIVLKELKESLFWLRMTIKADLAKMEVIDPLLKEGSELTNIIGKSVVTAKKGKS